MVGVVVILVRGTCIVKELLGGEDGGSDGGGDGRGGR